MHKSLDIAEIFKNYILKQLQYAMILPLHIKPNKIPRQTLNLARNFCFYEFIKGIKRNGGLRRLHYKWV
nr:MAG TPA: hypothetical protein [Caudoviricetes sp.]